MTCCIGYYPTITKDSQIIQGSFYQILNDPLYTQDMRQLIIPIQDNSIFKENKPYIASPDLLTADENYYGKGVMKGMGKCGKNSDTFYGKGLTTPGGRFNMKKLSHIIKDKVPEDLKKDIKLGLKDAQKYAKKKHLVQRAKKEVMRPLVEDMFKMHNKKNKPGQGLKNRLMSKNKNISTFNKREELKKLMSRLN